MPCAVIRVSCSGSVTPNAHPRPRPTPCQAQFSSERGCVVRSLLRHPICASHWHFRTAIINRCSSTSRVCASIARKYMRRIAARSARRKRSGSSRVGSRSKRRRPAYRRTKSPQAELRRSRPIVRFSISRRNDPLPQDGCARAVSWWQPDISRDGVGRSRPTTIDLLNGSPRTHLIIVKAIQLPWDSLTRLTSPRSARGARPAASRRNRVLRLLSIGRCEGEEIV